MVSETRLVKGIFVFLVKEIIASQAVAQVHVHHAPRRKHRFLVRIAEGTEDVRDAPDAFFHAQPVRSLGHRTDALARRTEDVRVVVFLESVELLLAHPLGHELLPRTRVYLLGEVVNGNFLVLVVQLRAID